ncbi:MAG: putative baseplate assembly protein [Candidatus Polarisedimenticolia bacterium]
MEPEHTCTTQECGCCEGISAETPVGIENRPGLPAIAYRVGKHGQFKETMLARLSGSRLRALAALTTRDPDDFSIALLDAWAMVADVLTFYQERIANEAYLRTATERMSVLELARLIDYRLRPGVAAGTHLAFTLEEASGALGQSLSLGTTAQTSTEPPPPIVILAGTRVQSVPAQDEEAQTFETVEDIEGRAEWNAMRPRLGQPQNDPTFHPQALILQGATLDLKPGDMLMIVPTSGNPVLRRIVGVTTDDERDTTRVDFVSPPAFLPPYVRPSGLTQGSIDDFPDEVPLDDSVVQQIVARTWSGEDLAALAEIQGWDLGKLTSAVETQAASPALPRVFAFRQRLSVFGHNAPYYPSLLKSDGNYLYPNNWDQPGGFEIWKDSLTAGYYANADLYLERSVTGVAEHSYVVLLRATATGPMGSAYKIGTLAEASLAGFGMSAKSTALTLATLTGSVLADNATDKPKEFTVRNTQVLLESEELALAELPILDLVKGDTLTLDGLYLGLQEGQRVELTGERADLEGVVSSEVLTIADVTVEAGFTVITFDRTLDFAYRRSRPREAVETEAQTVRLNANVAPATHGETVQETLGSGDASRPFQSFTLRQPPVTYISAPTQSGAASTLEVRVNGVLWEEVSSFFGHGPEERIYVTHLDDDGNTTVIGGDGTTGARWPTGQENIKATYRKGIGLAGLVVADQLTQLLSRPLGLKGVTNPQAATGAADPDPRDDARRNAPLTVRTLDRLVSLKDYEDFARAFSGIDKALATWTWFGGRRGVFVTVAGSDGAEVVEDSELYENLLAAMQSNGDRTVPLAIRSYRPRLFRVSAALGIDSDDLADQVLADVEEELRRNFGFDARNFGQPVHFSEVVTAMQSVTGVLYVDVQTFHRSDLQATVEPRIPAATPRPRAAKTEAAELLTLDPRPLDLEVVT